MTFISIATCDCRRAHGTRQQAHAHTRYTVQIHAPVHRHIHAHTPTCTYTHTHSYTHRLVFLVPSIHTLNTKMTWPTDKKFSQRVHTWGEARDGGMSSPKVIAEVVTDAQDWRLWVPRTQKPLSQDREAGGGVGGVRICIWDHSHLLLETISWRSVRCIWKSIHSPPQAHQGLMRFSWPRGDQTRVYSILSREENVSKLQVKIYKWVIRTPYICAMEGERRRRD